MCNDFDDAINLAGKQSEYDAAIRDSELVFFLFFRKVGEYTKHEFEVAMEAFKNQNKPKIVTYFKTVNDTREVEEEVRAFMEMLDVDLHHYYNTYGHIDTLKLGMLMQIKLMKLDQVQSVLSIQDGAVQFNGKTVAKSENIPLLNGHQTLRELTEKKRELQQAVFACREAYRADPTDANEDALTDAKAELRRISQQLTAVEKQTMEFMTTVAEMTSDGKVITHRLRAALKCFDAGDYEAAQMILADQERESELQRFKNRMDDSKMGLQGYVNEGLLWIRAEKTKILTEERADEIIRVYEELVQLTEAYNLDKEILYDYAMFLWSQNKNTAALTAVQTLRWYYSKPGADIGKDKWAHLFNALGSIYVSQGCYHEAKQAYQQSIDLFKELRSGQSDAYAEDLIMLYQNLGVVCFRQKEYDEADDALSEALDNCISLYKLDRSKYEPQMAAICEILGNLFCEKKEFEFAETPYLEAQKIYERLYAEDPTVWEDEWAELCNNLGVFYNETQHYPEAEEYWCKSLEIYECLCARNPGKYKSHWENTFLKLHAFYDDLKQPNLLLPFCQSAIAMFQKLEEREPGTYGDMLYWLGVMLRNLSKFGQ